MKKTTRRVLSLCLAIVLIMSLAIVASAASSASVTFSGYTAYLYKGSSKNYVTKKIPGANCVEHVSRGVDTQLSGNNYHFSLTQTASNLPTESTYASQVIGLLDDVGLMQSYTLTETIREDFYIEPDRPSGIYQWAVRFATYNASWDLYLGNAILEYGTISNAPTGQWAYDVVRVG